MTELGYFQAAILGIVQGLAEFLPVSSSGHLAIVQRIMRLDEASPAMLLFDVMSHVGTVFAVLFVFRVPLLKYLRDLMRDLRGSWAKPGAALLISYLGICAMIPTGIIGLTFKDTFEAAFGKPAWIGTGLMVTGTLLGLTMRSPRGRRGWRRFSWWQAALVGIAQGMAILPGISRSGSTICTATYLGMKRRWAAEFSFFIAIPAILGAAAIKVKDTLKLPLSELQSTPWGPIVLGTVISTLVGIIALMALLAAVRKGRLHYFSAYCLILGALVALGVI